MVKTQAIQNDYSKIFHSKPASSISISKMDDLDTRKVLIHACNKLRLKLSYKFRTANRVKDLQNQFNAFNIHKIKMNHKTRMALSNLNTRDLLGLTREKSNTKESRLPSEWLETNFNALNGVRL